MVLRKQWVWLLLAALLTAAGAGVWLLQGGVHAEGDGPSESLRTVLEVISLIKTQYVDDVDALTLISNYVESGTINGMLAATLDDPYTRYMDPQAFRQVQIDVQGEYGGIGIMVGIKDGKLTIIAPFEGTPGYEAGLRPGDRIVSIDGRPTERMSLDEAVSLMRGPEGTSIALGIQRGEGEPFEVEVVRNTIQVPSVTEVRYFEKGTLEDQEYPVGYIRLQRFSERTEEELFDALDRLYSAQPAGLILDLRDNPGGTLSAAIDVANAFLPDGPILHIVGRDGAKRTVYAFPVKKYPLQPMVVLVNEYTASASEIVSGALQDRGVAKLVGMTTFGKGLVQTVVPLRDGSALSLTSARYQTAGGRFIHETGIVPDLVVAMPTTDDGLPVVVERLEEDPQFLSAVRLLMQEIQQRHQAAM